MDVAARSGASRPSVWVWQQRFAEEGVAGLLRDKTRKPGKAPLPPVTIAKILALPCGDPPESRNPLDGSHGSQSRRRQSERRSAYLGG